MKNQIQNSAAAKSASRSTRPGLSPRRQSKPTLRSVANFGLHPPGSSATPAPSFPAAFQERAERAVAGLQSAEAILEMDRELKAFFAAYPEAPRRPFAEAMLCILAAERLTERSAAPSAPPFRATAPPAASESAPAPAPLATSTTLIVRLDDDLAIKIRRLAHKFGRREDDVVAGLLFDKVPQLLDACEPAANEHEELAAMSQHFAEAYNQRRARE